MLRADAALELGSSALSASGGREVTSTARPALVEFEHANVEARRGTLVSGLTGTLTPALIFLNLFSFAGHYAPSETDSRFLKVALDDQGNPDPAQLKLIE